LFASNQGSSVIFLGRKVFGKGRKIISLTWKVIFLGREIISLGREVISLTWKIFFLGRKVIGKGRENFYEPKEIICLTPKMAFFGRKTVSKGISKAEQGSFAPNPPADVTNEPKLRHPLSHRLAKNKTKDSPAP
jgi:hypothetical protein